MEVNKFNDSIQIIAAYGCYLTQAKVTDMLQKILCKQVIIPYQDSIEDWEEITSTDADEIIKAKQAASLQIEYPEEEVNLALDLVRTTINTIQLTDEQAYSFKGFYPQWSQFIGKSLSKDYKVQYNGKLYKVLQEISVVLEDQFPSINTASLYTEINPSIEEGGHAGTYADPIPYDNNMELELGKFYIQNEVIYECIRATEIPVYADLSGLVDNYVKVATNE